MLTESDIDHDGESRELWAALKRDYPEYLQSLHEDEWAEAEIEPNFLGFVSAYKRLAEIIPVSRVVYDFGCSYAPQAYYFRHHAKYVGIAPRAEQTRLHTANTEHYYCSASEYMKNRRDIPERSFAVVNYVPDPSVSELVRATFKDVFTFYPRRDHGDIWAKTIISAKPNNMLLEHAL
jgi:hypothetical protein